MSSLPETSWVLSGENARPRTKPRWPFKASSGAPVCPIPEPDRLVPSARGNPSSVGAEGDGVHEIGVFAKLVDQRSPRARYIADLDDIAAAIGKLASIGRERHAQHSARPTRDRLAEWHAVRGAAKPGEADVAIVVKPAATGGDRLTVGRVCQAEDRHTALGDLPGLPPGFDVEDGQHRARLFAGEPPGDRELAAVGREGNGLNCSDQPAKPERLRHRS